MYKIWIFIFCVLLTGCSARKHDAPIVDGWKQAVGSNELYRVQRGDTLYSIAWVFGIDFRDLAWANHLKPPYHLDVGEILRMQDVHAKHYANKKKPRYHKTARYKHVKLQQVRHWKWPAHGKIVKRFSFAPFGNHGIDIAGRYGEAIRSAASGTVVYSGAGIRGYGRIIIVKHSDDYLSAYAHNSKILVKNGQYVRRGQLIARMGRTNAGKVMLHFEIRRVGKPVNPMHYL